MKLPLFVRVPRLKNITAITLWFVVLYEGRLTDDLRRHETIHYRQYNELGVVGFLVLYLVDYLKARRQGLTHWAAYERIRFEQEAYAYEGDVTYLETRKRFAWRKFNV